MSRGESHEKLKGAGLRSKLEKRFINRNCDERMSLKQMKAKLLKREKRRSKSVSKVFQFLSTKWN